MPCFAVLFYRSIPAGAGEPRARNASIFHREVYPRGRGGTGYPTLVRPHEGGLSPRARGNPLVYVVGGDNDRSIPAGAGEPVWEWA